MQIPKIKFKPMSIEENIYCVKWSYFQNDNSLDVHSYTLKYFPKLNNISKEASKEQINHYIEKIVRDEYEKCKDKIISEVNRYNKIWKLYNDKYFICLSKYLNLDYPDNFKIIKATVGLIPVCPRNLDENSFSIYPEMNEQKLIEVCSHETLHFLWFKKWEKLYHNFSESEYNPPYIPWKYSEMVVDPILNSSEINSIINIDAKAYDIFYTIKDKKGISIMDNLINIYQSNDSIENKIRKGYEYVCSVLNQTKTK